MDGEPVNRDRRNKVHAIGTHASRFQANAMTAFGERWSGRSRLGDIDYERRITSIGRNAAIPVRQHPDDDELTRHLQFR